MYNQTVKTYALCEMHKTILFCDSGYEASGMSGLTGLYYTGPFPTSFSCWIFVQ